MEQFWSEARLGTLRELLARGFTASGAGAQLGCSRNAVIGKAAREGISLNGGGQRVVSSDPLSATHARRRGGARNTPAIKTLRRVERIVEEPAAFRDDLGFNITLLDVTSRQCRWGHGEPGDAGFHLCANPTAGASAWCGHHFSRVYQQRTAS
jgi:GcrA cell cycle regulator